LKNINPSCTVVPLKYKIKQNYSGESIIFITANSIKFVLVEKLNILRLNTFTDVFEYAITEKVFEFGKVSLYLWHVLSADAEYAFIL